jgi:threonine synthase
VSDEAILDAKALVGRFGFGCEPASGASVAGAKVLLDEGVISRSDRVVCILTGHALKDPNITVDYHVGGDAAVRRKNANPPFRAPADVEAVARLLDPGGR